MADANEGADKRVPYWTGFLRFVSAECDAYLAKNNAGGNWDDITVAESRSIVARAMLRHGIQLGLAFSMLDPDAAQVVYNQLTRDELPLPPDLVRQARMEHLQSVERFRKFLDGRTEV